MRKRLSPVQLSLPQKGVTRLRKDKFGYYYPAYRYYVSNAFRWYFTHPECPEGIRQAQIDNWSACETALTREDRIIKEVLCFLYTSSDTMENAIFAASRQFDISPDRLWTKIGQIERRFASIRGLI